MRRFHPLEEVSEVNPLHGVRGDDSGFHPLEEVSEVGCSAMAPMVLGPSFHPLEEVSEV